jgi:hypothetical protein
VAAFRVRAVVKEGGREEEGVKRLVVRMFEFCDGRRQWDDFSYRKCLGCALAAAPAVQPLFVPLPLPRIAAVAAGCSAGAAQLPSTAAGHRCRSCCAGRRPLVQQASAISQPPLPRTLHALLQN